LKKKGFSLIELLTVVAIIGILGAVGVVAYTGYVTKARRSAAENAMMQIALAQTEYYSNIGLYFITTSTCSVDTSNSIENILFDGGDIITDESGYQMCIVEKGSSYKITAKSSRDGCTLIMSGVAGKPKEDPEGSC
jgi:prepilin-type N-terminal cleavage/methylation domain-containing protein